MTEERKRKLKTKLEMSRARLGKLLGEIAEPLYDMIYVATPEVKRISTNGFCIYFSPDWLQKLPEKSMDFMLAHVLMHVLFEHIKRPALFRGDRFHLACDIIVNANLYALGFRHEKLPMVGTIYKETFYPREYGLELMPEEAFACVPFDPSEMTAAKERRFMIDSDAWWDEKRDRGERGVIISLADEREAELYEMDAEGEVFWVRLKKHQQAMKRLLRPEEGDSNGNSGNNTMQAPKDEEAKIKRKIMQIRDARKKEQACEGEEVFLERLWQRGRAQNLNWKQLINAFIQEEMYDYTFSPPDRRFAGTGFFLPDYNVTDYESRKVLFMVDTSGSVDDEAVGKVYAEIYSAMLQFNGMLSGVLCFFDTKVYGEIPISGITDLSGVIPKGGGGTDFNCIFTYANRLKEREDIADIVIFTDGNAVFPKIGAAGDTPVLWILTDHNNIPPWGKCAWFTQ